MTERDGTPGEWYLHLFDVTQPDLDWSNRDVRDEFVDVLRFWFDRGIDGFRIDVAHGLVKDPALPDLVYADNGEPFAVGHPPGHHPYNDRDGLREIYREWRTVADSYDDDRIFVAEAWVDTPDRLAPYVSPGQLHSAFDFAYLQAPWSGPKLRAIIDSSRRTIGSVGAHNTWVLSNHDVERHLTRFGRKMTAGSLLEDPPADPAQVDLALGTRRARAAVMLTLALPGGAYLYQGEELGLPRCWTSRNRPCGTPSGSGPGIPGGAGRLPGPDPVDRARTIGRLRGQRIMAAPATRMGRLLGSGAAERPGLDARALPPAAPDAPRAPGTR